MKLSLALALAASACVSAPDAENVVDQGLTSANGTSLNGTSLNGTSLNGTSLNGTSLNGTSLNGTSLNGTSLNGTSLNGTSLDVATYVGSRWTGVASNGATVNLRIDSATRGGGSNGDVGFYAVSYQTASGWAKLCGVDGNGAAVAAVAVAGTWNPATGAYTASTSQFSFACRFKTVAKCVELGYKPWKGVTNQLLACVRMLRADYCGTGVPYTADGTLINVYDNLGIQLDTESWGVEAEWTPAGARCINIGQSRFVGVDPGKAPPCLGALGAVKCGSFANGALLIDELSPDFAKSQCSTQSVR